MVTKNYDLDRILNIEELSQERKEIFDKDFTKSKTLSEYPQLFQLLLKTNSEEYLTELNKIPLELVVYFAEDLSIKHEPVIVTSFQYSKYDELLEFCKSLDLLKRGSNRSIYMKLTDFLVETSYNEYSLSLMLFMLKNGVEVFNLESKSYGLIKTRYEMSIKGAYVKNYSLPNSPLISDTLGYITNNRVEMSVRSKLRRLLDNSDAVLNDETVRKIADIISLDCVYEYITDSYVPIPEIDVEESDESVKLVYHLIQKISQLLRNKVGYKEETVPTLVKEYIVEYYNINKENIETDMFYYTKESKNGDIIVDSYIINLTTHEVDVLLKDLHTISDSDLSFNISQPLLQIHLLRLEMSLFEIQKKDLYEYQPNFFSSGRELRYWLNITTYLLTKVYDEDVVFTDDFLNNQRLFEYTIGKHLCVQEVQKEEITEDYVVDKHKWVVQNINNNVISNDYYIIQSANVVLDKTHIQQAVTCILDNYYFIKDYCTMYNKESKVKNKEFLGRIENFLTHLKYEDIKDIPNKMRVLNYLYTSELYLILTRGSSDFEDNFLYHSEKELQNEIYGVLDDLVLFIAYRFNYTLFKENDQREKITGVLQDAYNKSLDLEG